MRQKDGVLAEDPLKILALKITQTRQFIASLKQQKEKLDAENQRLHKLYQQKLTDLAEEKFEIQDDLKETIQDGLTQKMLKLEDAKKELHDEMQNRIDYANFIKHYHEEKEQFF